MSQLLFFARRSVRRIGIMLLVIVIIATSVVGWVLDRASDLVHYTVKFLGLSRVEDWMRRQSVWFAFFLVGVMLVCFVLFKSYELSLIMHKHIFLALSYGLLFKIVWMTVMNYLMHLFGEQFLRIRFIAWGYGWYCRGKVFVLDYLKQSAIYRRASAWKRKLKSLMQRRSILAIAKRFHRTTRDDNAK